MFASRQIEIPFFGGIRQQPARGSGTLARGMGRIAISFLCKHIVPAANRVGADLLEIAALEIAEIVSGRKNFKTAGKSLGRQTLRKRLGIGGRRRSPSIVIPTKSAKQTSRSRRDSSFNHFSLIKSSIFRYQNFVAFSGILGGKVTVVENVLSSREQEVYHTTLVDKECIEFEFQTNRKYYVAMRQTYLALKMKLVRGLGYETYNTTEIN